MKNTENITTKIAKKNLNMVDWTFYFLIRENDKTVVLKERVQREICQRFSQKFEPLIGVRSYAMRSGPGVRSSLMLKEEWSDITPEKIAIVLADRETKTASLLSQPQRNMFFDMVMKSTEDLDTLPIAEYVINEIDSVTEEL